MADAPVATTKEVVEYTRTRAMTQLGFEMLALHTEFGILADRYAKKNLKSPGQLSLIKSTILNMERTLTRYEALTEVLPQEEQ